MSSLSESEKRKLIKEYFEGNSNFKAWLLIILGVPLLAAAGLGLVLIGIGVFLLWRHKSSLSSDRIDAWTEEDYRSHDFIQRAWQLSGFTELAREPILLRGLANSALSEDVYTSSIVGDDATLRSTPVGATVILCSPDQLGRYQTGLDLTTGNRVNERFIEVFYQDVVGVGFSSRTDSLQLDELESSITSLKLDVADIQKGLSKAKLRTNLKRIRALFAPHVMNNVLQRELSKIYRIDISDGEHITIPIRDGRPTRVANNEDDAAAGDGTARSIYALRAFVREKKRALLFAKTHGGGSLV